MPDYRPKHTRRTVKEILKQPRPETPLLRAGDYIVGIMIGIALCVAIWWFVQAVFFPNPEPTHYQSIGRILNGYQRTY